MIDLSLSAVFDNMHEVVLIVDSNQTIVRANLAAERHLGVSVQSLIGNSIESLSWHCADPNDNDRPWQIAFRHDQPVVGQMLAYRKPNEKPQQFLVNASRLPCAGPNTSLAMLVFNDVTALESSRGELTCMLKELERSREEIRKQNKSLQHQAMCDPMTGCMNRRGFFSQFESLWQQAIGRRLDMACLMLDVDHFKSINDNHGHSIGDEVLIGISKTLMRTFRDTDLVCRYGGEEFCIVLPYETVDVAVSAAKRFQDALAQQTFAGLTVTVSIGASARGDDTLQFETLLDQADQALYVAKRSGRNCIRRWTDVDASQSAANEPAKEAASYRRQADSTSPTPQAAVQDNRSTLPTSGHASERETSFGASIPHQAVSALLAAMAFRDPVTAEHSNRVAALCVETGRGLMSDRELRYLETAALLHDIGKIGVPDAILTKPGKLTPEEFEEMRRHSRIGYEIVKAAFDSSELSELLRTHGVPYEGDKSRPGIPSHQDLALSARIINICNAFDAMTSDRNYRKGMPLDEAFAELRSNAGKQFDPELVEHFIVNIGPRLRNQSSNQASFDFHAAMKLGHQVEQIAEALDDLDIPSIQSIALRLVESASKIGAIEVASTADQLAAVAESANDVEELIRLTQELFNICNQSQQAALTTSLVP